MAWEEVKAGQPGLSCLGSRTEGLARQTGLVAGGTRPLLEHPRVTT